MASFYRPLSSRSSWQVLAGLQTGLSALDAGSVASLGEFADLGERAVSLGGDYIDHSRVPYRMISIDRASEAIYASKRTQNTNRVIVGVRNAFGRPDQ